MTARRKKLTVVSVEPKHEFDVSQVVFTDGPKVFCITLGSDAYPEDFQANYQGLQNAWRHLWAQSGASPIPVLFVLAHGMTLQALSGAELKEHGFIRVH